VNKKKKQEKENEVNRKGKQTQITHTQNHFTQIIQITHNTHTRIYSAKIKKVNQWLIKLTNLSPRAGMGRKFDEGRSL